ncbi:hypothetical protein [Lentzea sp. HUAS12]|uniref:hypothetical protein n=1 Tax=Lentzea sp. HUAS12 TaxID=2951806 RepID=UPI00209F1EDD|nr:hypothetical protein [Lentzea sp. HUAS12]USX51582.1 hypothetical protein ND450_40575 [Lentzea sp. HUAS12]
MPRELINRVAAAWIATRLSARSNELSWACRATAYATKAVLEDPIDVPDGVSDHQALALLLQGTTAVAAAKAARIPPGDRVLVEAATGGVGRMVVFGYTSGEPLDVTASDIFRNGVAVMGLPRGTTPQEVLEPGLEPVLGDVHRFDEIAEARRALEARTTRGKLIARP